MALLLHIDTSASVCSVALSEDLRTLAVLSADEPNAHGAMLTTLVDNVLQQGGHSLAQLNAVCLSTGPGSYTGLRIGSSTAKGLCYALNIPMIGVSTLEIMARSILDKTEATFVCALIDARRMEAYTGIYNNRGKALLEKPCELNEEQLHNWAATYPGIVFTGNALPKIEQWLNLLNLPYEEAPAMLAAAMVPLAFGKWQERRFEDIALFTPNYMKTWEEGQQQKRK